MTYLPELSTRLYVPLEEDDYDYFSVGWLGDRVERSGPTDPRVMLALRSAARSRPRDWGPVAAGPHTCEICNEHSDAGEFVVQDEERETRYLLPNMVFHYIEAHRYRLPDEVEWVLVPAITREPGAAPPVVRRGVVGTLAWVIPGALLALAVAAYAAGATTSLRCDRASGQCVLEESYVWLPISRSRFPVEEVAGPELARGPNDAAVYLHLRGRPRMKLYTSALGADDAFHQIDAFFAGPDRARLDFRSTPDPWFWILAGLVLVVAGAIVRSARGAGRRAG